MRLISGYRNGTWDTTEGVNETDTPYERNATQGRKHMPWFRAELPARREQRTNKEESDWITKHYPVDGRQKSPSLLSALDIGFTEVSDQWRARLHRLSTGGKWKKPAGRCSRQGVNPWGEFWVNGVNLGWIFSKLVSKIWTFSAIKTHYLNVIAIILYILKFLDKQIVQLITRRS